MISELCTFALATGATRVVLRHEGGPGGRIEAPNWHSGGFLIVNASGRLFRVPLASPALEEIPTGSVSGLNNDHGPSPDGRTLAISAKSETGGSCIYLMPVEGGEPVRVTPRTPSWWHGWSPDGARLAYAAARGGGPVGVTTCAVDGSDERPLAPGFDHADGPDYAPDGAWIWFNGERDGSADLWRVRPDGTDLERMTEGETVDWFPHPSPDGRHVLFLAYPPGTRGHPADLPVALRLMPQDGGGSREVLRLRGGQGTSNVPCWAPDGGAFAFVRYPA